MGVGESGAAGGDGGVLLRGGGVDGDGVQWAFDQDGPGSGGEPLACLVQAEQQLAFAEEGRLRAVEVLGACDVGSPTADETGDRTVAGADRQHGPVAEGVVQPTAATCSAGQAGCHDGLVGVTEPAQVPDEELPGLRGVADLPLPLDAQVEAAFAQVGGHPAAAEPGDEEVVGGELELGKSVPGDLAALGWGGRSHGPLCPWDRAREGRDAEGRQ